MTTRRELISNALQQRFRELCDERIGQLAPADFGELSGFVTEVREQLAGASFGDVTRLPFEGPHGEVASDSDCLSALRRLALGEPLTFSPAPGPQPQHFVEQLRMARSDPEQRFQLLTERYACPAGFAASDEHGLREHILERLMVHDRAKIESSSITAVDANDLLLKLNLIAIQALTAPAIPPPHTTNASVTNDLRFLDALNYYYELIPANWRPQTPHHWLLVSFLALYARALTAWFLRYECEQAS